SFFFLSSFSLYLCDIHSFPTRRSSDLPLFQVSSVQFLLVFVFPEVSYHLILGVFLHFAVPVFHSEDFLLLLLLHFLIVPLLYFFVHFVSFPASPAGSEYPLVPYIANSPVFQFVRVHFQTLGSYNELFCRLSLRHPLLLPEIRLLPLYLPENKRFVHLRILTLLCHYSFSYFLLF